MTGDWQRKRDTFRHGSLPDALVAAALERLEADGVEAISLRELAGDAGVNHRAVYRHFPDKSSLMARVSQEGWGRLALKVSRAMTGKQPGERALVAGSVGFFAFAREHANLFHLMAGARINTAGEFPDLERALGGALKPFMQGFIDAGTAPEIARDRAALFVAALTGIVVQVLHKRLHVTVAKAPGYIADAARMLISGLR